MIIVGFLITLFTFFLSLYKDKKIVSPIVIHSGLWMVMYFLQLFRTDINHDSYYYLIFALGNIFFLSGYLMYSEMIITSHKQKEACVHTPQIRLNDKYLKMCLIAVFLLFVLYLYSVSGIIKQNFNFNVWQSLRIAKEDQLYSEPFLVAYGRIFVTAFTFFIFYMYLDNKKNVSFRVVVSLVTISLIMGFTAGNRGMIFLFIISMIFIYILKKDMSNKKIALILSLLVISVLLIFGITSFMKFVYEDQSNKAAFLIPKFRLYFTSSMPAFVEWIREGFDYEFGKNTFNIFVKIGNFFGSNTQVPSLIQNYIYVGNDYTNVYTIYQYYVRDFGILYSLFIQLFLGYLYAKSYFKNIVLKKLNVPSFLFLSTMYFPLIYQFFDDKFFSLTSTWIQFYFWYWLFSKMFINKVNYEVEIGDLYNE